MDILNLPDAKCFQVNMRSGWEQAKTGEADIERLRDLSTPWTRENALIFAGYVAGVFAFQTGCPRPTLCELVNISHGEAHYSKLKAAQKAGAEFTATGGRGIHREARTRYPKPEQVDERDNFCEGAWAPLESAAGV